MKDPLSLNLYSYCVGNPITLVDIDGHAPGDLFRTMDQAAYDFALLYNEKSINKNAEYGSAIYAVTKFETLCFDNEAGGTIKFTSKMTYYSYTKPSIGHFNGVIPNLRVKGKLLSTIHTHGRYTPAYTTGNDDFSTGTFSDIWWADVTNLVIYMVNPKGELRKYTPGSNNFKGEIIVDNLWFDVNHPDKKINTNDLIKEMIIIPYPTRC